ncbi:MULTISPECIES: FecR family protein [Niastella]|uniref:FecR family protein n=1 Tax=Niastella soli TaxID=2821487 RepID=A0ABS3Z1Y9_9BACT|nr:FecR family protein [Niastella soli]MBO9204182.1 FecR family protein [Niastella soli]
MQKDAIRYLIGQYMNDELTAQQQAELLQLLGQHEERELIEMLREMMEAESVGATAVDADAMQASLQRVLSADKPVAEMPGRVLTISRRWRWVAAAACLLAVGITGYVLLNKKSTTVPVAATSNPYKNDVQPGGQKAMLTLADGKQIVLDSAGNGLLAQQGNAQVVKEGAGLKYQSAGSGRSDVTYNTLSTPRGGEYKLILPDGSKVWLNSASTLRYPTAFTGSTREVALEGEGYFEVTKLAAKPFRVITKTQFIEVLGTHFNVNAYSDEAATKTTLLEGKVKVMNDERSAILKPGEQASVSQSSQKSQPITVQTVDVEETVAWTNGQFIFREQRIESIMKQISRWYNVEVAFAGKPTQEGFTATIPRSVPVSKVLRYLELTTLVHFKIDGNRITVLP